MVSTALIGWLPIAVSSLSITQSAPKKAAVATSDTSARVGSGDSIMLSSIWVATIVGLPYFWPRLIIRRWVTGTVSAMVSTARSPRATIIASAALPMSSMPSTAALVSTLATMWFTAGWLSSFSIARRL